MIGCNPYDRNYYEKDARRTILWGTAREVALSENIVSGMQQEYKSVMDIGCGDGFVLFTIKNKSGSSVWAFDISYSRLINSRKNIPGLKLIQGDVLNLPFKDNAIDIVVCSEVLEHISDYERAIDEIIRVARRKIIVTVPNEQEPALISCPNCEKEFYLAGHINKFDQAMIKKIFSKDKKRVINVRGFYTIYSYNRLTLKLPKFLRMFMDRFLTGQARLLPFLKPNFLLVNIDK